MDTETTKTIAHHLGFHAYFEDAPRDAAEDSTLRSMYIEAGVTGTYHHIEFAWYEGYSAAAEAHAGILAQAHIDNPRD
jgi:hypothetical protein